MRPSPINLMNTHIVPVEFEYFEPRTLEEALRLLDEWGEDARVLAGGTDLLVQMKLRRVEPRCLINVKRLGLRYIREEGEEVRIGALTRLRDLERSELIEREFPALHEAVRAMASVQVRNMATIGGNLCNASPAADTAPPLMVYGARLRLKSLRGERAVPVEEFFRGPGETVLERGEILVEVEAPRPRGGSAFIKLSRTAMDLAKVNVAVLVSLEGGVISAARIALGAVAPTPVRAREAERFLEGRAPTRENFRRAGEIASTEIRPITDLRSTAWYRREVSKVLVADALERAVGRVGH